MEDVRLLHRFLSEIDPPSRAIKINAVQCEHLSAALLGLSDAFSKVIITPMVSPKDRPNLWKEIYRAGQEAQIYRQHCSSDEWPIEFLTRLTTGEAYSLHLHDLALSRLLLYIIHITDNGEICRFFNQICEICRNFNNFYGETDNGEICRIFSNFYEEMDHFMKIRLKYVDEVQLIKTCQEFAHATEDKNIVQVSKFLGGKLKGTIPIPVSTEVESAGADTPIPAWLEIDPADLVLKTESGVIGEGSFGHVYEGSWLGVRVAAKEMSRDARDVFELEASVLAKLHSPFIVHLIGTCIKDSHLYLVMELVSSNLEQLLEDRSEGGRPPFSLPVAVDIMLQISRAMEYLHSQGIMHLDLKASNVLFELSSVPEPRDEGYGRVKLCDFGMASTRLFSFRAPDPKGTCYWRAPEVFPLPYEDVSAETTTPEKYTSKADVYSFAMTCYEILTGKQPFAGVLPRELHTRIVNGERPILEPSICPFVLAKYIQQCWDTDPDHRPCFEDVSKFFRKLKLCILNSPFDWKKAFQQRFYPDFGFVEGEKKSIFLEKLEKWKNEELVTMHSRLDEMLFVWRFLTLEMRRGIAIDIASFLARIHGKSAKRFLYFDLESSTAYLDWKLKPIFYGVESEMPYIPQNQSRKLAKRFTKFINIQAFGKILIELSTGCTWKDESISSIQRQLELVEKMGKTGERQLWEAMRCKLRLWRLMKSPSQQPDIQSGIEFSHLGFIDLQLVEEIEKIGKQQLEEEMEKKGKRQLWEVVRWCKLGLWCLSKSPSQQPNIQTVLRLLKEGAPSGDSSLQDYLSPIPTIEKVHPYTDEEALTLMSPRESGYCCVNMNSLLEEAEVSNNWNGGWGEEADDYGGWGEEADDSDGVSEEDVADGVSEDGFGLYKLFGEE